MQWIDDGIILNHRPWSEGFQVISLLTPERGRHAGLMRVSKSSKRTISLEIGNFVHAKWTGRLAEQLGNFTLEVEHIPATYVMYDSAKLAALCTACSLLEHSLPERHPYPALFDGLQRLLSHLCSNDNWLKEYIDFELALLQHLGFGLDLPTKKTIQDLAPTNKQEMELALNMTGQFLKRHLFEKRDLPHLRKNILKAFK